MGAITQIPEHYTTQFDANWEHLVQQKNTRLKEYVKLDTILGKEKTYNQMDQQSFNLITVRSGQTTASDVALAKRWIRPKGYDLANWLDEFDEELLGQVSSPNSAILESHMAGWNRLIDQTIITTASGSAITGEDGTTLTPLPSSQEIAVNYVHPNTTGANSGLNLGKLIKAKSILGKNEALNDGDPPCIAVSQQQLDDLLGSVNQVSSADYNNVKALVDGTVDYFMGFKFLRTELLDLDAVTDIRTCLAWVRSGIIIADGGRKTHMDILPSQNHTVQIRSVARIGGTRMQEKKVVKIFCDESP